MQMNYLKWKTSLYGKELNDPQAYFEEKEKYKVDNSHYMLLQIIK